jgi:radical SAM protein with 4Fe4S-binding SPASM domain
MNQLEAKILSAYKNIREYHETGKTFPRTLALDISNSCNNNCDGCYFRRMNSSDIKFMDKKLAIKVIKDSIEKLGVEGINFTGGGEPSIHPNFLELIKLAVSTGKGVGLITNCSWTDDSISKFVAENLTYVRVGLDCENGEMYYKITRNDIFDRVIENIETMVKYKKKATIGIKFLLRKNTCTVDDIYKMIALGKRLEVDSCQFKILYGSESEPTEKMILKAEDYLESIRDPMVSYNLSRSQTNHKCILNFMRINVDADGSVYLCPRFYHRKKSHLIGNLNDKPIYDIWFNDLHWDKIKKIDPDECNVFNCMLHSAHDILNEQIINNKSHLEFFA